MTEEELSPINNDTGGAQGKPARSAHRAGRGPRAGATGEAVERALSFLVNRALLQGSSAGSRASVRGPRTGATGEANKACKQQISPVSAERAL